MRGRDRLHKTTTESYDVVRCRRCGLVSTSPRLSGQELSRYYPSESYYAYHEGVEEIPPPSGIRWNALVASLREERGFPVRESDGLSALRQKLLGLILRGRYRGYPQFARSARILDVGCGSGSFLSLMRSFGYETVGVEVDGRAVEHARAKGHMVYQGSLESHRLEANSFDCIRFSHVLEHLESPGRSLREAERLLRPGGSIIILVPNIASAAARFFGTYWFHLDLPRHLYHFSFPTISVLLEGAGFTGLEMHGYASDQGFLGSLGYILEEKGVVADFGSVLHNGALRALLFPAVTILNHTGGGDLMEIRAMKPLSA